MLLKFNHPDLANADDTQGGLMEEVRAQVCENMALYADKYQEEFEPYVTTCVKDVGAGAADGRGCHLERYFGC